MEAQVHYTTLYARPWWFSSSAYRLSASSWHLVPPKSFLTFSARGRRQLVNSPARKGKNPLIQQLVHRGRLSVPTIHCILVSFALYHFWPPIIQPSCPCLASAPTLITLALSVYSIHLQLPPCTFLSLFAPRPQLPSLFLFTQDKLRLQHHPSTILSLLHLCSHPPLL